MRHRYGLWTRFGGLASVVVRMANRTQHFWSWCGRLCLLGIGLLVTLSLAAPGQAEIYRWKDAQGRLHFAQDLSKVPPRYREQARGGAVEEGQGAAVIQRYDAGPAAISPSAEGRTSQRGRKRARREVHRIRVQKAGSTMLVKVRLNESVTAPFYVDTGASDVVLPISVARELGLEMEGARTALYGTANGVIQQSLVTLDSVDLGGARAEKVPAAISTTMTTGLLGLSFFNHFRYRFDPASGVITLESNGMVESGRIRGGRSKGQWRRQFQALAARRAMIERRLEESNPNRSRERASLREAIEEVDRQIAVLEDEADEARVPMQWRD